MKRFINSSIIGLILLAHPLLAQGPLAPPGPPAPMMKTLQQMEPRTPIEQAGHVITAPGSYYLTTDLNGGGSLNGIVVQASGVTIDLRGFSIVNCAAGISAPAGVHNVVVHNGIVRDGTGVGVELSLAGQCRLEGVMVRNNAGDGARVGDDSLVTSCIATANGGRGLVLGNRGAVSHCVANTNGTGGIAISSNCQASDNNCTGNGSGAGHYGLLTTGNGNRVEGNSANQNGGNGLMITGTDNLIIRNNACGNNVSDYSVAAGNSYGQILSSPGAGFTNTNPWANFNCGTQAAACGNGIVESGETCDDGNLISGDGCTAACAIQPGFSCSGAPSACSDINECATNNGGCSPNATCTNTVGSFSCTCNPGYIGDGITCQVGTSCTTAAQCDDGNSCTTDSCVGGACVHSSMSGGTVCRASTGPCDVAEVCDGTGSPCPADTFVTAGMVCRASAGACDVAETCTGTSATCPTDAFRTSGTVCRASAGVCDVAETCTGASATCPTDGFQPNTSVCRAASGPCDVAENCTGVSSSCPVNGFKVDGTTCNDGNACTQTDVCQSGTCTGTNPVTCPSGQVCNVATGVCTM